MPEIRAVTHEDIAAIEAAYPISPGTPGDPHRETFQLQECGAQVWLMAWDCGRPCGSVVVRWPECPEATEHAKSLGCAEIEGLGVDESRRGEGIGRALMVAAIEEVRQRGVGAVGLEVTAANPNQIPARALYRSLGFRDAGFGQFISGYSYWDADGTGHRDEEPHRYLVKSVSSDC